MIGKSSARRLFGSARARAAALLVALLTPLVVVVPRGRRLGRGARRGTLYGVCLFDSATGTSVRRIGDVPSGSCQSDPVLGRIRAGVPTTIPDPAFGCVFRAQDAGPGTLLVLVAEQALDLSRVIGANLGMKPIRDARAIVVELAAAVQSGRVTPDLTIPNGRYRWSFATVPYAVAH